MPSILDYGADQAVDNLAAFQAAAASGRRVFIPNGQWFCSTSFQVTAGTEFEGETEEGAQVIFGTNQAGFVLLHDQASLERLKVRSDFSAPSPKNGVSIRSKAQCSRVTVAGFGGHGWTINGSDENACLVQLHGCKSYDNGGCGLKVLGFNANAGIITGFRANGNLDWGIRDTSLLGNTYVGCWVEDNNGKGYNTAGDLQQSKFIGCYDEPGTAITLSPNSEAIGCYPSTAPWP